MVITLDIGLYKLAKHLEVYHEYFQGQFILRLGELHTVMAMLRTIRSFIDNSGLDRIWLESDMHGPATHEQILDGNHVLRAIQAHMTTLLALFSLYQEVFEKFYTFKKHYSNKSQCT